MINICNLSKHYGNQPLFRQLNLDVAKGSVVAIIGPSGSGKSTLLRCINGLVIFQSGSISVNGVDKAEAESQAISLFKKVQLDGKVKSYPGQLSGGEQQRVAIARALAMKPDAMLFDEPTSSLDPEMVDDVLTVIKNLVSEGMTTIIATHEMDFARNVSSQVVFIEKGEIIEHGNPQDMFSNPTNSRTKVFLSNFVR
ncbi:MAG: amino acid ABC transporter ATP-binding protein [Planctomycetes bacterium]|nr:amino acid ABC transporter ATP-binding protein [Planctomycetota bacterium]